MLMQIPNYKWNPQSILVRTSENLYYVPISCARLSMHKAVAKPGQVAWAEAVRTRGGNRGDSSELGPCWGADKFVMGWELSQKHCRSKNYNCLIWHLPRFKIVSPKIWQKISQSNTTKTRRTKSKKGAKSFTTFLFLATQRAQTTIIEPNKNKNKIIQPLRPLGVQPCDWWVCLCIKMFVKKCEVSQRKTSL